MARTKIEWCDYTINPVKGLCPVACSYCYARRMYKRFKWNPEIRWESGTGRFLKKLTKPSRIFVGSTMELWGDWIKDEWMQFIFQAVKLYPEHTFIFLTKQPQNLIKGSPFPDNCWVGVSATNPHQLAAADAWLSRIDSKVKFVSLEPFLSMDECDLNNTRLTWERWWSINWLIIGQQTPIKASGFPTVKAITEIMTLADKHNVPIFLKNNLRGFLPFRQHYSEDYHGKCYELRQEFPITN